MSKNLNKYFSIKSISDEKDQVVITVHADDPLDIAEYPLIKINYKYVTVKKYSNRNLVVLTIIYDNGNSWSFNWGSSQSLVGDECWELRDDVLQFIKDETGLNHFKNAYSKIGD